MSRPRSGRLAFVVLFAGFLLAGAVFAPRAVLADPEVAFPSCFPTAGDALEICRSNLEPEGVFYAPQSCRFAYDVQILRLKGRSAPGPLQVVVHGEPRRETRRGEEETCEAALRGVEPGLGGSVRTGRLSEQLATAMPPTGYRFWSMQAQAERPRRQRRRGRRARRDKREETREEAKPAALAQEGSGARDPMTVAGRDWAGDDYHYLFMVASEAVGQGWRRVLIQGRTVDFESLDIRSRRDGAEAPEWVPFGGEEPKSRRRRRARAEPPALAPVLDEDGKPIAGHCAAEGFEARGLVGSISVVDQTYHYFYTDVLPADCGEPLAKRRMGLFLRTSRDLTADKVWSAPKTLVEGLPGDTLVRIAKAKGMERWAVAYTCFRPANAPGGPIADICLQYTPDLSVDGIAALKFYAEPASAVRSPAFLGLRSGGDASGRYGREGFFWMTDRYGNLDTPATYTGKGGFLTWFDRNAPRADGSDASTLYGRPVFWSTWTVKPRS